MVGMKEKKKIKKALVNKKSNIFQQLIDTLFSCHVIHVFVMGTSLSEINNKISRRSSRIILEKTLIALKRYNILIQKKLIKTEIKFNFC